ncbi:MAG: hypothetical protein Q9167_001008 [Letrouitia subvulpina]
MKETIYIGTFEVHRRYKGDGSTCKVETKKVAIVDNGERIVLLKTFRCQISNHLNSVTHELDEDGKVFSYEEYSSFGNTTYQPGRSETEAYKRYRFAAREHDKEKVLYYNGARYFDCKIGRWISSGPNRISDGMNVFYYAQDNLVTLQDTSGASVREAHASDKGRSWLRKKGRKNEWRLVTNTAEHSVEIKHAYDRVRATGSDNDKEALAGAITDTWLDIGDIILMIDGVKAIAGGGVKAPLEASSVAKSALEGAAQAASVGELVTEGTGIRSCLSKNSEAAKNILCCVTKAGSGVLKESETVLPSLVKGGGVNAARAAKRLSDLGKAFASTGGAGTGRGRA